MADVTQVVKPAMTRVSFLLATLVLGHMITQSLARPSTYDEQEEEELENILASWMNRRRPDRFLTRETDAQSNLKPSRAAKRYPSFEEMIPGGDDVGKFPSYGNTLNGGYKTGQTGGSGTYQSYTGASLPGQTGTNGQQSSQSGTSGQQSGSAQGNTSSLPLELSFNSDSDQSQTGKGKTMSGGESKNGNSQAGQAGSQSEHTQSDTGAAQSDVNGNQTSQSAGSQTHTNQSQTNNTETGQSGSNTQTSQGSSSQTGQSQTNTTETSQSGSNNNQTSQGGSSQSGQSQTNSTETSQSGNNTQTSQGGSSQTNNTSQSQTNTTGTSQSENSEQTGQTGGGQASNTSSTGQGSGQSTDPSDNAEPDDVLDFACVGEVKEEIVCERRGFMRLQCPSPRKIRITYANYGRIVPDSQTCKHSRRHLDRTDCVSEESQILVKTLCDGHASCSIRVRNDKLGGDPCRGTYKYLQVQHQCLPTYCFGDDDSTFPDFDGFDSVVVDSDSQHASDQDTSSHFTGNSDSSSSSSGANTQVINQSVGGNQGQSVGSSGTSTSSGQSSSSASDQSHSSNAGQASIQPGLGLGNWGNFPASVGSIHINDPEDSAQAGNEVVQLPTTFSGMVGLGSDGQVESVGGEDLSSDVAEVMEMTEHIVSALNLIEPQLTEKEQMVLDAFLYKGVRASRKDEDSSSESRRRRSVETSDSLAPRYIAPSPRCCGRCDRNPWCRCHYTPPYCLCCCSWWRRSRCNYM